MQLELGARRGGGGVTQTSATAVTAATNVTVVVGIGGTNAVARSGCSGTPGVLTVGTQGGTSSFASISSTGGFSSPQYDSFGGASGVGDNISYAASGLDTADNEGCVPGAGDCAGGGGGGAGGAAGQMSGGTAGNWSTVNGRAGTGGPGVLSSISGTSLGYGAGAFGVTGGTFGTNYGCGGYGSFTAASYVGGGCYNGTAVVNPLANRGGGGLEANGGSGVVIIKYLTPTCAAGGTCIVGDTGPGGGVVFYVAATNFTSTGSDCNTACKYFEAAPRGWGNGISVQTGETTGSSTVDPILKWCSNTTSLRNASTKTAIGDGRPNTTTSTNGVAACTSGAIYHADLYAGGTKTDWHLPSKDELNQMCKWQRGNEWVSDATVCTTGTLNSGTGASAMGFQTRYWSSNENGATYAWYQQAAQNSDPKTVTTTYVRPVRAFG